MADADVQKILENSQGWKEVVSAAKMGRTPQSVSAIVPASIQELFVLNYAKLVLNCDSGWDNGKHPDLIYAGSFMTPPGIAECRALQGELALHPAMADRRLAVIWAADLLSLDAENSLLKITEEPPENGCVLFVSEKDQLIPTIKSRVWSIHIELPEELLKGASYPVSPEEWAAWLEKGKKEGTDALLLEMESWVKKMSDDGNFALASNLETLIKLMEKKNMSLPMVQDLTLAVVKEGISCEQIFSNLR